VITPIVSGCKYLIFGKLSPPIPSADSMILKNVENPEEFMGCIKLEPADNIKTHFPSPLAGHLHILVQRPTCTYACHLCPSLLLLE